MKGGGSSGSVWHGVTIQVASSPLASSMAYVPVTSSAKAGLANPTAATMSPTAVTITPTTDAVIPPAIFMPLLLCAPLVSPRQAMRREYCTIEPTLPDGFVAEKESPSPEKRQSTVARTLDEH